MSPREIELLEWSIRSHEAFAAALAVPAVIECNGPSSEAQAKQHAACAELLRFLVAAERLAASPPLEPDGTSRGPLVRALRQAARFLLEMAATLRLLSSQHLLTDVSVTNEAEAQRIDALAAELLQHAALQPAAVTELPDTD